MVTRSGVPNYRRQKRKSGDLAFIDLSGQRRYLGEYGTEESQAEYRRVLAEWLSNGQQLRAPQAEITLFELSAQFLRHARSYYRHADGTQTNEVANIKLALRPLTRLYAPWLSSRAFIACSSFEAFLSW